MFEHTIALRVASPWKIDPQQVWSVHAHVGTIPEIAVVGEFEGEGSLQAYRPGPGPCQGHPFQRDGLVQELDALITAGHARVADGMFTSAGTGPPQRKGRSDQQQHQQISESVSGHAIGSSGRRGGIEVQVLIMGISRTY